MDAYARSWKGWSPSRRNWERAAKKESRSYCRLDQGVYTSAVVGAVATMMIIMLGFHPTPMHGSSVSLAGVSQPAWEPNALREDSMHVTISADGRTYFATSKVAPDELPADILDRVRGGAERRVYLYVDARARYVWVKHILDAIHAAGITNVTFIVQRNAAAP